jgi:hypothetical protein
LFDNQVLIQGSGLLYFNRKALSHPQMHPLFEGIAFRDSQFFARPPEFTRTCPESCPANRID